MSSDRAAPPAGDEPTYESRPQDRVDADALDLQDLVPLLTKLADAAERSAAYPMPDDVIPIRMAVNRAGWEFKRTIPTTDWQGMGPCPVIIGRRTGAIHAIFRVLKACLVVQLYPPKMLTRVAAELRAVLAELQPTSPASSSGRAEPEYLFRSVGKYWDIRFGTEHGHFPNGKGLEYIAKLLAKPLGLVPALDLVRHQVTAEKVEHTRQEVSDDSALRDYEKRIRELQDDHETAVSCGHTAKAAEILEAIAVIRREMESFTGLGGKKRRLGPASPEERACNAVRQAILRACKTLKGDMPELAKHVDKAIRYESSHVRYVPAFDPKCPTPAWSF
jgi:hypothetical protein